MSLPFLGLFNLAFGAINAPAFGVADAFKDDPAALNNAIGYFMLGQSPFCGQPFLSFHFSRWGFG